MTNLTLSIEEEDLRQARITALQQGTSLNAVIRDFIKEYIDRKQHYQQLTDKILQSMDTSSYVGEDNKCSRDELYER
uniref:CopG family transcriptional regulator n=1 Tax=uncultured Thiotrichaceae bacterium TaxID=298394 RepID=A0A6S6RXK5_9GAMM|nr:MAG: Unknown protein [uncultured Thiotrichaceae bacterium]